MPPLGQFCSVRKAPDRDRALRGHDARPGAGTVDSVRFVRESSCPERSVGARAGCVLAALARMRLSHTKNSEENRISGARKSLPGWTAARTRISSELGPLYRRL